MKKISLFFLALSLLTFYSCEEFENTAEASKPTFLPAFNMEGASFVSVPCGSGSFSDPGMVVTEGGEPIAFDTNVSSAYFGAPDVAGPDVYTIGYSAENVDGIKGSAFRTVVVEPCPTNLAENLEGKYSAVTLRDNGEEHTVSPVFIVKTSANTYALSHGIAGFYDHGRGYGSDYASKGTILTANDIATNDITASIAQFPIWGNTVQLSNFQVDPVAETISWTGTADFGSVWTINMTLIR